MAIERQDSEFRHPLLAACLRELTDEEAAKLPVLSLEQDGVAARRSVNAEVKFPKSAEAEFLVFSGAAA